jgi:hypothetical protein
LTTFEGLLDLLSACTLAILGNVLDPRTYRAPNQREGDEMSEDQNILWVNYDLNDITENERSAISYARGVALCIFDWVRNEFDITGPDGCVVDDLPSRFLVQILKAILSYKAQAMRSKLTHIPHCDTASVKRQVNNVVVCDPLVYKLWNNGKSISDNSLEFEGKDGYSVVRKATAGKKSTDPCKSFSALSFSAALMAARLTYAGCADPGLCMLKGVTPLDTRFKGGQAKLEGLIEASKTTARPFKKSRLA